MSKTAIIVGASSGIGLEVAKLLLADVCPVCFHPQSYFEIYAENY